MPQEEHNLPAPSTSGSVQDDRLVSPGWTEGKGEVFQMWQQLAEMALIGETFDTHMQRGSRWTGGEDFDPVEIVDKIGGSGMLPALNPGMGIVISHQKLNAFRQQAAVRRETLHAEDMFFRVAGRDRTPEEREEPLTAEEQALLALDTVATNLHRTIGLLADLEQGELHIKDAEGHLLPYEPGDVHLSADGQLYTAPSMGPPFYGEPIPRGPIDQLRQETVRAHLAEFLARFDLGIPPSVTNTMFPPAELPAPEGGVIEVHATPMPDSTVNAPESPTRLQHTAHVPIPYTKP